MNILLFNASNSESSIHRVLLDAVRPHLAGHDVTYSSTADFDLPLFSTDLEREEGYPEEVEAFYELIAAHDAVVLACPEHNGSIPAAFKNLFDWTSRYANTQSAKMFAEKAVLLFSTSPGPNGGATNLAHLAGLLPWQGATVVGQHSLGGFAARFTDGKANAETDAVLKEAVQALFN
ncbi:MAG: NADPH-dependent FMN reductase [Cardiobacteriaceae bacterium]|nr:NADPH-dependent FMN reductase [Cardiobacteriaceae bacterium]